jgi:hypothetical protein
MADRAHLERLTVELADSGKLIEAGWVGLRVAAGLVDAPADQLREMRMAFFAGAQHLFGSIMTMLEPGEEGTEADLRRMDLIARELDDFYAEIKKRVGN